ncbi:MAG: hypothetical protein LBU89_09365 [Fibromonadaceae bacterium]|jgi:hypothetical protein|nr:hypothetical protein [Fibromonadaceae bacterium]
MRIERKYSRALDYWDRALNHTMNGKNKIALCCAKVAAYYFDFVAQNAPELEDSKKARAYFFQVCDSYGLNYKT